MNNKESNLIVEYELIKNEINQKIELHNNLITFTITTTAVILSFALSQNLTLLYIMPFCIIIPMSIRIRYYRLAMAKLSAYLIVFLEPQLSEIKWETRNTIIIQNSLCFNRSRINNKRKKNKYSNYKLLNTLNNYECLLLSVSTYTLYVLDYLKDKDCNLLTISSTLLPLIFVIFEYIITKDMNSLDIQKINWIKEWQALYNKIKINNMNDFIILNDQIKKRYIK